jgi:hypothetical protein
LDDRPEAGVYYDRVVILDKPRPVNVSVITDKTSSVDALIVNGDVSQPSGSTPTTPDMPENPLNAHGAQQDDWTAPDDIYDPMIEAAFEAWCKAVSEGNNKGDSANQAYFASGRSTVAFVAAEVAYDMNIFYDKEAFTSPTMRLPANQTQLLQLHDMLQPSPRWKRCKRSVRVELSLLFPAISGRST